ncbi:hypothetical protein [Spirillospora sp. CA-294931]|uniref:hypothetical protein n=1 Tax=Spirillospora sp. CA-294931 TaxID=3240042 RepID=UPI003D89BCDF
MTPLVRCDTPIVEWSRLTGLSPPFHGVNLDSLRYSTVPDRPDPSDPGLLALDTPVARELFERLKRDS